MMERSDNECLVSIVNQAINEKEIDEIDEELIISSIKKLKHLHPELTLRFVAEEKIERRVRCQGYCLEKKVEEEFSDSLMVTIGQHKEHSYCHSCFSSWVLSRFYDNPMDRFCCQRCVLNQEINPIEIPLEYIHKHIIPSHLMSSYTNFYMEKNYKKCIVCENYFIPNTVFMFDCGHSCCPKDLVGYNLKFYKNLLKENKENFQDSIEFKIACKCGKQLDINMEQAQIFSQYIENLHHYFNEKDFYVKYKKFFSLEREAKWRRCCKKYKLEKDKKECLHCGKCLIMDHPIHIGYSCEDFLNLPNDYEIDFNSPQYQKNGQVSNMNPLILKNISAVEKVFRIKNKYMEVAMRYKIVWEYGFLFFNELSQVENHLKNNKSEGEIKVCSSLNERLEEKFAVLCEINGTEIIRNSDLAHPISEDLIFIRNNEIRALHKKQVRYLNLIILT